MNLAQSFLPNSGFGSTGFADRMKGGGNQGLKRVCVLQYEVRKMLGGWSTEGAGRGEGGMWGGCAHLTGRSYRVTFTAEIKVRN